MTLIPCIWVDRETGICQNVESICFFKLRRCYLAEKGTGKCKVFGESSLNRVVN